MKDNISTDRLKRCGLLSIIYDNSCKLKIILSSYCHFPQGFGGVNLLKSQKIQEFVLRNVMNWKPSRHACLQNCTFTNGPLSTFNCKCQFLGPVRSSSTSAKLQVATSHAHSGVHKSAYIVQLALA